MGKLYETVESRWYSLLTPLILIHNDDIKKLDKSHLKNEF